MVLQFRTDPLKGSLVIVANERALRPMGPGISCPFCNGAEKVTPPTKLALPSAKGWTVRCFDNAFAIVKPRGKYHAAKIGDFFYESDAFGDHEVIVETPDHHQLYQDIESREHQSMIFEAYRNRLAALSKRKGVKYVHLFKNHGRMAGASLEHEHSQIISLPFVPPIIGQECERRKEYRRETGKCLTCEILRREGENVLFSNLDFAAVCPSFARFPFETWVVSKRHKASMLDFGKGEGIGMVRTVQSCINALFKVSRDYNIAYHNNFHSEADAHFHAEIYPRPNIWAGVELGTGLIVNSKTEKESISALKSADYSETGKKK